MDALPGVNPEIPSPARMYDYYLGGKDHFASDRAAAEQMIELGRRMGNDARELARANRGFLGRAVRTLAESGIRQFLDLGAGLPTQENVHEVALRHAADSRIVYVDNDPVVIVHAHALLSDSRSTVAVAGDLRDPEAILSDPEVTGHLDLSRSYAVLMAAVLHFIPDDAEAVRVTGVLRERLPSGGYLVLSHVNAGDVNASLAAQGQQVYAKSSSGGLANRDAKQILTFFDGLDLLDPGLVPVGAWRPDPDAIDVADADLSRPGIAGGVARKP
ncbi:SAM-dependent methyltransferase [Nonomuraea sp. NPDC050663]|uniref:SAM-dependent methyltransferase n=1 Tax=Nonomuraea sp. NPDC050663 TaxID=3364370 RepID=UPI0037ABD06E